MAKMWAGRFQKEVDDTVNDFNASIGFDARLYKEDIQGSIAHATMLGQTGILDKSESEQIVQELHKILADIEQGTVTFSADYEDIHMNMEQILTQRIGDTGKRLHTARSRNDQVAVDMRLYCKKQTKNIAELLAELLETLLHISKEHLHTIMPGYTHLQRAQPITFAHHLMAYGQMFYRDLTRLQDCLARMDEMPLGSGALATTTYPIDRHLTARLLGFAKPTENSLDGVSDRDYCIELCADIATIMMHLSRLSEEIIAWCSWEFRFIELDDAYATGSSIMPQKKNPDICELIRGKTGRTYGDLTTLLTLLKGLPLAYNKDMQEDKEAVFDAIDTVQTCLTVLMPMLQTMRVCKENMRNAASAGFLNATDCADYLTKKGIPFRDAYKMVGQLVNHCITTGQTLDTLPLEEYQAVSPVFAADIYNAISLEACIEGRCAFGGPAPKEVERQIACLHSNLDTLRHAPILQK